jgi:hypothetical protein
MSVKFQITLPDDLAVALKRVAARKKMPLAQFIRESMEGQLRQQRPKPAGGPFASITDLADASDSDLSDRVDEVLHR